MHYDAPVRRSLPRSIAASLMVVYYYGAGVVPKGIHSQIMASFTTIAMHVDAICGFVCKFRYAAPRYVLPISMSFEGHLMHMAVIMWSILRRQKA